MKQRFSKISGALVGVVSLLVAGHGFARESVFLDNPTFDLPSGSNPETTYATCGAGPEVGISSSDRWTTYANTQATSINSWLQNAPGGFLSNLVAVGGNEGGLVQVLPPVISGHPYGQGTVTDVNRFGAWIYVVAGAAQVVLGNGGCGGPSASTSTVDQWEWVSTCGRPDGLNNEVVIYSTGGPAVFYADDAWLWHDPSCMDCAHPATEKGAPLSPNCGSCEARICTLKPECCTVDWDSHCADLARATCSACLTFP